MKDAELAEPSLTPQLYAHTAPEGGDDGEDDDESRVPSFDFFLVDDESDDDAGAGAAAGPPAAGGPPGGPFASRRRPVFGPALFVVFLPGRDDALEDLPADGGDDGRVVVILFPAAATASQSPRLKTEPPSGADSLGCLALTLLSCPPRDVREVGVVQGVVRARVRLERDGVVGGGSPFEIRRARRRLVAGETKVLTPTPSAHPRFSRTFLLSVWYVGGMGSKLKTRPRWHFRAAYMANMPMFAPTSMTTSSGSIVTPCFRYASSSKISPYKNCTSGGET